MPPLRGHTGLVLSVVFSPDGSRVISGSSDKTIRVVDSRTGELAMQPLTGHTGLVLSVSISADGSRIVSGSSDNTVRIWSALTGEPVMQPFRGHTSSVLFVMISADGSRVISGSLGGTILTWDIQTTGEPAPLPVNLDTKPAILAIFSISADGSRVVSGLSDNTICVWDIRTGELVMPPLRGHADAVSCIAVSADGNRIVSGSKDGTTRIWDISKGAGTANADGINVSAMPLPDKKGWIRGPDGELLLWVPKEHRACFGPPPNVLILGRFNVTVDLSDFAHHGSEWVKCHLPPSA